MNVKINTGRIKATLAGKGKTVDKAEREAGLIPGKLGRILRKGECDAIALGKIARVLGMEPWELVDK